MSSALGCLPVNGKPGMRRSPISHLGSAELWRYAEIYCKEFISFALARLLLDGDHVRRLSDTRLDAQLGRLDGYSLAQTLTLDVVAGQDIVKAQD